MGVGDKESGTAGGVKRDISGSLARGVNAKRLCNRMKKKDAQMCELRYEKKIDVKNTDLGAAAKESCGCCVGLALRLLAPPAACLASSGTGACLDGPARVVWRRAAHRTPRAPWLARRGANLHERSATHTPPPPRVLARDRGSCVSRS